MSHWQSNDESQVATDWSSSGIGSTVKWYHIGSQVASDWPSIDTGLTVNLQSYDESQVAMNLSSSGMGLTAKWCHIGTTYLPAIRGHKVELTPDAWPLG